MDTIDREKIINLLKILEDKKQKNVEAIINKEGNVDYLFGTIHGISYCSDLINYILMGWEG